MLHFLRFICVLDWCNVSLDLKFRIGLLWFLRNPPFGQMRDKFKILHLHHSEDTEDVSTDHSKILVECTGAFDASLLWVQMLIPLINLIFKHRPIFDCLFISNELFGDLYIEIWSFLLTDSKLSAWVFIAIELWADDELMEHERGSVLSELLVDKDVDWMLEVTVCLKWCHFKVHYFVF
jgi:hypothetical protein